MLDAALFPYGYMPEASLPDYAVEAGALERPVLADAGSPRAAVVLVTMTARAPGGLTTTAPLPLVAADALDADVDVTRAHTPSAAVAAMQSGAETWSLIGQNLPRFAWPSGALRVDAASENKIRNPRLEGAGAPSLPTNMSVQQAAGLTTTVLSYQDIGGIPTCTIQASGTANATRYMIATDTITGIAALPSQAWAGALMMRQDAAPAPPPSYRLRLAPRNAAGAGIAAGVIDVIIPLDGSLTIFENETAAITSNSNVAAITLDLGATLVSGQSYDFTITFGLPMLEQRATVGAAMLPVVASPGASSRAVDLPIWTPTAFPRRGCIVIRGIYDAAAGATALGLLQLDNGTDNFRVVARVPAGGLQPEAIVVVSGTTTATLAPSGSFVAGSPFVALLAWSPGGVRFGTSVGGVASVTTAMPIGVSRAVLGHANASGTMPMDGSLTADFYEFWPSEAEAAALIAA